MTASVGAGPEGAASVSGHGAGRASASIGAIVLVGGRARRLGGAAKPLLEVGGATPWQRTLAALAERGAAPVVAVGPALDGASSAGASSDSASSGGGDGLSAMAAPAVTWVREDPPFGGPVAAIAAGLPALAGTEWVLLLAGDLVHPGDVVRRLHDAVAQAGARDVKSTVGDDLAKAVVFRAGDRAQWLAGAYRVEAVRAALAAIGEPSGAAAHRLLGGLPVRWIPDEDGITADIDTPADLERARAALADPSVHDEEP